MPGGTAPLQTTSDVERIEAPVTWKAYLICAFASFGGIFFGYDSGYINGVTGSTEFIHVVQGPGHDTLSSSNTSLIVSILSAGTFFGALIAGDCADIIGRQLTVIIGCMIYIIGVALQMGANGLGLIVAGRLVAGLGVGFESAIVILYMSEICPRKVRGALVAGYQFAITLGLLIASCVDYAVQDRTDSDNISAVNAQIAFVAIFIFFFASTWGPGAWIVIGEVFPLPIRSRGVALSTASNWLWNTIIAVITPHMVGTDYGDLKSSVFFVWGGLCTCAFVYAYFIVPETKGLSLEQVDRMLEQSTPRTSAKWKPTKTFASEIGHANGGKLDVELIQDVERKGSIF